MSDKPVKSKVDRAVLAEAVDYYLKLQEGSISSAELKAWQAWFMRSKAHQVAFQRLEALHGALDHLHVDENGLSIKQTADTGNANSDFEGQPKAAPQWGGGSVISLVTADIEEKTPAVKQSGFRRFGVVVSGIAAMVMVAAMTYTALDTAPNTYTPTYITDAVDQQVLTLKDGSIVELAPDSEVSVHYTKTERRLVLEKGQAIFTVSKNPERPFVVEAGKGTVTAIGTVFNVKREAGNVAVRVLEGTVAVRPTAAFQETNPRGDTIDSPAPVALVTAGKKTEYGVEGRLNPVEETDVHAGLDWRVGVLTMVNEDLATVIRKLNQFLQSEIAIGDEVVGNYAFTGTVYPDQVDNWLEGLQKGYPIKVVRLESSTILMRESSSEDSE